MNEELENKIKKLGMHFGANHIKEVAPKNVFNINFQEGYEESNSLGKYFYTQKEFYPDYVHGKVSFSKFLLEKLVFEFPGTHNSIEFKNCIFLYTETTGLALSAGTFAFMVGVAKIIGSTLILRQYFLKSPSEESAMLLDLSNFINPNDTIVTYNGIGFDIPILRHRYVLHKIPIDYRKYAQLDLLKYSRSLWRFQFDDRSLKSVEKNILNYQRSTEEVPGWMAPEIYRQYLKTGNLAEILGVFYHNAIDVVSLAALLYEYVELISNHVDTHNKFNSINYALARLHEKQNNLIQSINYYNAALQQENLPDHIRVDVFRRLAKIHKNSGNLDQAIVLWEAASLFKDLFSIIELSKFYEHKQKDFKSALYWVEMGIQIFAECNKYQDTELENRKLRIIKKWSSNG